MNFLKATAKFWYSAKNQCYALEPFAIKTKNTNQVIKSSNRY